MNHWTQLAYVALCETTVCHYYNNNRDLRQINTWFCEITQKRNSAETKFCNNGQILWLSSKFCSICGPYWYVYTPQLAIKTQRERETCLTALFSMTTRVSRYHKGKTNLDFTGARDSEWQWHQLGHTQVCTSLQTDNFTGQMPFLQPNQQRQSTEGTHRKPIIFQISDLPW